MLPAANLLPTAQDAIECYLVFERRQLCNSMGGHLGCCNGPGVYTIYKPRYYVGKSRNLRPRLHWCLQHMGIDPGTYAVKRTLCGEPLPASYKTSNRRSS
jgi:hypothetical protein